MAENHFDIAVIGGGIVGLSTALNFSSAFPHLRLLLLEKESQVGSHQSGHNSGVIHSGIYYKPGSLKAKLCVEGAAAMVRFLEEHGLPFRICGKLIVATHEREVPQLDSLLERGRANGIAGLRMVAKEEAHEIEPHCGGVAWLLVPCTGITDYPQVCAKYADLIIAKGGSVKTNTEVKGLRRHSGETIIATSRGEFTTLFVLNCAGLHSDRVTRMAGEKPEVQIVPFRGEYYDLRPQSQHLVKALIYPVPDLRFPFLGVHFTRGIAGGVHAGPNAVLAFHREGYHRADFSFGDMAETLSFPGFWRMAGKYWRSGAAEFYRSWYKPGFVRALQKLVPEIGSSDLVPDGSGVRAQALRSDGSLVDDFQFVASDGMLHVWNVPSPAATASLTIGREIVRLTQNSFRL